MSKIFRAAALAAWAAFFVWLIVSGEIDRYIGPRTQWVVTFGALALAIVAVGYAVSARSRARGDGTFGIAVMLLPIALVFLLPKPSLGSLAASRKLSAGTPIALQPQPLGEGDEVSFAEIEYASESSEYAATIGLSDGYPVELTGFVTHPDNGVGDLTLTRFAIFCCAADVVPHSVPVMTEEDYDDDQWLTVKGTLEQRDGTWVVNAESVRPIAEPDDPYIR